MVLLGGLVHLVSQICTADVCGVQSVLCAWGVLQNGMDAQLADIPPHNNKAEQVVKSIYPGWPAYTRAYWLDY